MKIYIAKIIAFGLIVISIAACTNAPVQFATVNLQLQFPVDFQGNKAGITVEVKNLSTEERISLLTDSEGKAKAKLEYGKYDFTVGFLAESNGLKEQMMNGGCNNVRIIQNNIEVKIDLVAGGISDTWVIKEIYYAGCINPKNGKAYSNDQYIEIYNNSDHDLYADGLCIAQTADLSNNAQTHYWDKCLPNSVAADFIYSVPGNGKAHLVKPGQSIVIAQQGLNHKEISSQSVDLSKASFEWFDEGTKRDVDVQEVPNMKAWYKAFLDMQTLYMQGWSNVFIFKPNMKMENFMKACADSVMGPKKMIYGYSIPVECIIDGVATGDKTGIKARVLPTNVDNGATYCTVKVGKCIRRKILRRTKNRIVLKDTNNSTNDFDVDAMPCPFGFPD